MMDTAYDNPNPTTAETATQPEAQRRKPVVIRATEWLAPRWTAIYRFAVVALLAFIAFKPIYVDSLPSVSVYSLPRLRVDSLPSVSVDSLPRLRVDSLPSVSVDSLPSVSVDSLPSVRVYSLPEPISVRSR